MKKFLLAFVVLLCMPFQLVSAETVDEMIDGQEQWIMYGMIDSSKLVTTKDNYKIVFDEVILDGMWTFDQSAFREDFNFYTIRRGKHNQLNFDPAKKEVHLIIDFFNSEEKPVEVTYSYADATTDSRIITLKNKTPENKFSDYAYLYNPQADDGALAFITVEDNVNDKGEIDPKNPQLYHMWKFFPKGHKDISKLEKYLN